MSTATFQIIVASVLAAELLTEFEATRAQIGLLTTATGLVGALTSPMMGGLTDRLGSVIATRLVLIISAASLTALALSPTYGFLLGAALATGIANGGCNPATNALIVDYVPMGSRGLVTGIKQSGVQIGTFLGGLLLPVFTALWNWRLAVLMFLAIPLGGFLGLLGVGQGHHERLRIEWGSARLPSSVRWIAVYGFISGLATQALIAWIPLFAEEDQLWSGPAAGSLIALVGFTGIASRIGWSRASERIIGHGRTLRILSLMTTLSASLLAFTAMGILPSWVLVPAAFFIGAGAIAWNAVGMLAVMEFSPEGMVGKGTGLVLFGFLFGVAIGPPVMGLSVDVLGTYAPGWLASGVLLSVAAFISFRIPAGSTLAAK